MFLSFQWTYKSVWPHYRVEKSLWGHGKATAIRITQVTALTRSGCILQYGGLFGSIRWRPEKGGDRFNKVTAYSGSTVVIEKVSLAWEEITPTAIKAVMEKAHSRGIYR